MTEPTAIPGQTVTLAAAVKDAEVGDVVLFVISSATGEPIDAMKAEVVDGFARAPWAVALGSKQPPMDLTFRASCLGHEAASGVLRVVPPDLKAGGGWFLAETGEGAPAATFEEEGAPLGAAPAWLPDGRVVDGTALILRCDLAATGAPILGTVEATFTIERGPAPGGAGPFVPVETVTAAATSATGIHAALLRWVARLPGAAPSTARVTLRWKHGALEGGTIEAPPLVVTRAKKSIDPVASRVHLALRTASGAAPLVDTPWTLTLKVGSRSGVTDAGGVLAVGPIAPGDYDLEVKLKSGKTAKLRVPSGFYEGPRPTIVPEAADVEPPPPPPGQEPLLLALRDDAGVAIGLEPWVVGLADGGVTKGALDAKGVAQVPGAAGTCLVVWPKLAGEVTPPLGIQARLLADVVAPQGPWSEADLEQALGAGALEETGFLVPTGAEQAFGARARAASHVHLALRTASGSAPVANTPWTLTLPGGPRSGTTDAQGTLEVRPVEPGDYALDVKLKSGKTATLRVPSGLYTGPRPTIVPEAADTEPSPPPAGLEPLHLALRDGQGGPVGGETWVVGLPDGRVVTGALDPTGQAKVASPAGTCFVVFRGLAGEVFPPLGVQGQLLEHLVAPLGPWAEADVRRELGPGAAGETAFLVATGAEQEFSVHGLVTTFEVRASSPGVNVVGLPFTVTMPDGEQRKGTVGGDGRVRVVSRPAASGEDDVRLELTVADDEHAAHASRTARPPADEPGGAFDWLGDADGEPRS